MNIEELGFVYMITNPNGRIYVGSTNNTERRFRQYEKNYFKSQIKIHRSIKKYGWSSHTFEIVWAGPIEEMLKYETLIGWGFNVLEPGNLNLMLPKLGEVYSAISEETRQKMSNSAKGKIISQELRKIISKTHKGKITSEETKRKMSIAQRGKKISNEAKLKMRLAKLGKKNSIEHVKKMSEGLKKPILQFDKSEHFIKEWCSADVAAKTLNIQACHIAACCKQKRQTCGGFKWKYKLIK